jgi:hypothetical protein
MFAMELALGGAAGPGPSGSQPASGYAATYFPGTPTAANAQRVTVTVGREAQNTDFALIPVRLARVAGMVMSSEGKPLEGALVTAMPLSRSGAPGLILPGTASTTRTARDGAFTLTGVAPGEYTLSVRSVQVFTSSSAGGDTMMVRTIVGGPDGAESESATMPIVVSGEDLANVLVMTSKGATVSGRLTFDGGSTPPIAGVRVTAASADVDGPAAGVGGATVKPDGSFDLRGLTGRRIVRVANLPPGWALKAVRINGEDVTDSGAEFAPGQEVRDLEVVATNTPAAMTGRVTGADGAALKDYTVVVFSDDPQQWTLPFTRWVTGTRPDQEGRFRIPNLPPGAYNVAAVEYVEQGAWGDPELLERLKAGARRVTLTEGETEQVELRLAAGL